MCVQIEAPAIGILRFLTKRFLHTPFPLGRKPPGGARCIVYSMFLSMAAGATEDEGMSAPKWPPWPPRMLEKALPRSPGGLPGPPETGFRGVFSVLVFKF